MNQVKIELNIALDPDSTLGNTLTNWSQDIAGRTKDTRVMLSQGGLRLSDAPHLTLYQVPILARDLDEFCAVLKALATSESSYSLTATGLTYNKGERSLEVGYNTPEKLVNLQNRIINQANKFRGDMLLERDPGGNSVASLLHADGELGENIRKAGYSEIGNLFRPHATLNWFGPKTDFNITAEQKHFDPTITSGSFDMLTIYILGSHGRCVQRLVSYPLNS